MAEPSAPWLLLWETSGRAGFVALAHGAQLRGVRLLDESRRQGRDLAPAVADLLRAEGRRPADVKAVVVGRGPGSYTGLRVGIISAKAFAYATGCALVAVDTFAVVAHQAPPDVDRVDVLADAQQDRVYVQPFARAPDGWRSLASLAICKFDDWLALRDPATWVSGPGLYRWAPRLPAGTRVLSPGLWGPTPDALLMVGLELYQAGQVADAWSLEPLYLRPSSAEEQWSRLHPT